MNNLHFNDHGMDVLTSQVLMNQESADYKLPMLTNYYSLNLNSEREVESLPFQQDPNQMISPLLMRTLVDTAQDLMPLNDLSQYCFGDCLLNGSMGACAQGGFQQLYYNQFQTQPHAQEISASERRNIMEYQREQEIEALTLDKDEKYFHLLKPYQYQRMQHGDNLVQKVTYTYICKYDGCNKTFAKACNFLDHVRMHEGIKPYKCNRCSKEFVQKCNLKKHFKRHLSATLEERKVYKCTICQKGFTERYNLKTHMKMHS
eukprot:CAMPEP_0197004224 /NCGR_PEP_ID=MMETSP1380-20130617/20725_1 /TAXON_ID=5936 /ORGANISM="Euplotes crassus, Strain CT5" /LENGTH=259 /DNA_ID=CAMNT_0042422953 /DNA_START=15 /DNA_END=794 /DNA_ORIENTATION=+